MDLMGNKINDTSLYPATAPAATDRVLGIDVSDTGNDANGEVVTFTVEALRDASAYATAAQGATADTALQPGANISTLTNDAGYTTATGTVDTSGTPVANDFARFTDANTIEGRSYAEVRTDLGLVIGTDVLAHDANLQSFVTAFTLPTTDGTADQVLKTDGSGNIGFADGGGGGLVPISKTTASADAAIDIALTGGYSKYYFNLDNITSSVDAALLYIRVSDDSASTFEASGYRYTRLNNGTATSGTSASEIIPVIQMGTSTGERTFGQVTLWPANGSHYTFLDSHWSQFNSSTALVQNSCTGLHESTTAVTHVRFFLNTGTISGVFHLYGIADGA